jgi:hypothetical protein
MKIISTTAAKLGCKLQAFHWQMIDKATVLLKLSVNSAQKEFGL